MERGSPKIMADWRATTEPELAELMPGQVIARGVCRLLTSLGYASLTEFTLRTGRRVDVIALNEAGEVIIVEVKSSLEDFRSDHKWPEYEAFCDLFFFAVPEDFPQEVLPEDRGLMTADAYGAAILREPERLKLNAARRKSLTLKFALVSAQRLTRLRDPEGEPETGHF